MHRTWCTFVQSPGGNELEGSVQKIHVRLKKTLLTCSTSHVRLDKNKDLKKLDYVTSQAALRGYKSNAENRTTTARSHFFYERLYYLSKSSKTRLSYPKACNYNNIKSKARCRYRGLGKSWYPMYLISAEYGSPRIVTKIGGRISYTLTNFFPNVSTEQFTLHLLVMK